MAASCTGARWTESQDGERAFLGELMKSQSSLYHSGNGIIPMLMF